MMSQRFALYEVFCGNTYRSQPSRKDPDETEQAGSTPSSP